jgi:hypothetical protein
MQSHQTTFLSIYSIPSSYDTPAGSKSCLHRSRPHQVQRVRARSVHAFQYLLLLSFNCGLFKIAAASRCRTSKGIRPRSNPSSRVETRDTIVWFAAASYFSAIATPVAEADFLRRLKVFTVCGTARLLWKRPAKRFVYSVNDTDYKGESCLHAITRVRAFYML